VKYFQEAGFWESTLCILRSAELLKPPWCAVISPLLHAAFSPAESGLNGKIYENHLAMSGSA
jgi:hypothetical protein